MSAGVGADGTRPAGRHRLGRADVVLLLGYLVLAVGLGYLSLESPLRTPLWTLIPLALGALAAILLPARPTTTFAAVLALAALTLSLGSGAEALLALVALYRAGVTQSARRAWAAFGIAAAVGVVAGLIFAFRIRLGPRSWGWPRGRRSSSGPPTGPTPRSSS